MTNKQKIKGTSWENLIVELLQLNVVGSDVRRIAGSGALGTSLGEPLLQGDIVAKFIGFPKKFRIEAKVGYGGDTQLTVKKEWFDKIKAEAENSNAIPALMCKFLGSKKRDGVQYFVAFDFVTFISLINYVDELKLELDKETEKNAKYEELTGKKIR